MSVRRANRLAGEKSPYLLQHAHNPVDWHPWDDEAFALARATDRPIFLSIGYATCHWCHVMEKESFEDERVARLLNESFVPIKVDREERPDVDRIYMTAMQALGLGGGWPLNVFLTPELAPFYGGTYFPPESRGGHPGMIDLLPRVAQAWREERAALEENGARLFEALGRLEQSEGPAAPFAGLCDAAWFHFERSADPEWGGFGRAPKFPTAANLAFLWRDAARVERTDPARAGLARELALLQLARMREGGIHDHLGGGFHRYSVDRQWLVPHFEKMLYDQAQLLDAYCDAYRATGLPEWAETAHGIACYVTRDLSGTHGGYLSAEDADSEGEEGRFYVWRPSELEALGASEVARRYGVTEEGNFEHGASILHLADPSAPPRPDLDARLLEARSKRPRPLLDDKVITAWNGLMIGAMARASWILDDPVLSASATRAGHFALTCLRKEGRLVRRWRDGEAGGEGQLDDHAFLAHGCLELLQATCQPEWLEHAVKLVDTMIERFADRAGGGFFESAEGDPSIKVRMKDAFDGAELAGNSVAARVLLALAALTDREDYAHHAQATLDAFARRIAEDPAAMPMMLVAAMDAMEAPRHVAIVAGSQGIQGADTHALIDAARAAMSPRDLLLVVDESSQARVAKIASFVGPLEARDGVATAYVCVERACRAPTTDPAALRRELLS